MKISSLSLRQFRNLEELSLPLDPEVNFFLGQNGSGKTNLLESLSILSLTKSCRGSSDEDLVSWGQSFYRIRGELTSDASEVSSIEAVTEFAQRKRRAFFRNDVRSSAPDIVGHLPTVTFLPQDLHIFRGPPAERRRLLDQLLSQISPTYLRDLSSFQRVLKHRNALLKRIREGGGRREDLALWDQELSQYAGRVTLARQQLIETLNCTFAHELQELGENRFSTACIRYVCKTCSASEQEITDEFLRLLAERYERDILLATTTIGPHRDDWVIEFDSRPLESFASRGQERLCLLALLFLEVSYIELQRGEKPVIMLDDVFSELDDLRQEHLLKSLSGYQVILTSTHIPSMLTGARIFDVAAGQVSASAALSHA